MTRRELLARGTATALAVAFAGSPVPATEHVPRFLAVLKYRHEHEFFEPDNGTFFFSYESSHMSPMRITIGDWRPVGCRSYAILEDGTEVRSWFDHD